MKKTVLLFALVALSSSFAYADTLKFSCPFQLGGSETGAPATYELEISVGAAKDVMSCLVTETVNGKVGASIKMDDPSKFTIVGGGVENTVTRIPVVGGDFQPGDLEVDVVASAPAASIGAPNSNATIPCQLK